MDHLNSRPFQGLSEIRIMGDLVQVIAAKIVLGLALLAFWGGVASVGIAALITIFSSPAPAQTVAAGTVVDFGPLLDTVLDILAPTIAGILSALVGLALQRLYSWLGLRIDDSRRVAVEQALQHAIGFVLEQVGDRARGGIPIDVRSRAIAMAANYAERSVPGALKHFKIERVRLEQMVESRLQGLVLEPGMDQSVSRPVPASA